jgi:hypothetical protein
MNHERPQQVTGAPTDHPDHDGKPAGIDWRELVDGSRVETHPMPTPDAMMLGRHIKAALGHLRVAEDLAEQVGIDLSVMIRNAPGYELCELFRTAANAVEELDGWAVNNAPGQRWRPRHLCRHRVLVPSGRCPADRPPRRRVRGRARDRHPAHRPG